MFCPECGKQVEDDSKFCEHCGHPTDNDPQESPTRKDESVPNKEKNQNSLKDKRSIMVPITIIGILFFILIIGYLTYSSSGKSTKPDVSSIPDKSKKLDVSRKGWIEFYRWADQIQFYKIEDITEKDGSKIIKVWEIIEWTEKGRKSRLDNMKNLIHTWTPSDDETLYTMTLEEIDCPNNRHRTIAWHDCDKDGYVTNNYEFNQEEWEYNLKLYLDVGSYLPRKFCSLFSK